MTDDLETMGGLDLAVVGGMSSGLLGADD